MKKIVLKTAAILTLIAGVAGCANPITGPFFGSRTPPPPPVMAQQDPRAPVAMAYNHNGDPTSPVDAGDPGASASVSGEPLGGNIANMMDENDRSKLSGALEKPVGRTIHWTNENSKVSYTAVATRKVVLNGNQYCRKYVVTAMKNNVKHRFNGTACIVSGNWQTVG